ncbi:SUMF1/EgtB/PvdO family nonheme iron enzyme [Thalassotalea castellviae]|uniref:SUMF1/EgtB/PvdO family nonheme iron enzyme n=1 Tax=Thalassotalea castellviae TaxID=3075612 RepID=A0ABU3A2B8_9GAMM|nr:SUMF1/EgtB/PvdO family nonheme iron enzyme [Thalassotalea sp. W431]MDT0604330.1 SUMF1/EgtB/PvdO family nonheme iron enzyme [Thalassotalea sp. W431]
MVGSSFKGNDKDIKLITDDYYFILERALSKSDDGSEVWLAIDEGLLQARLKNSQKNKEDLLQHHRFVMKFTRNRPHLLTYHDNEFQILETIQHRYPLSKSLPSVHCAVPADTCFIPGVDERTGKKLQETIPNKAFIVLPYITGDSFTHLSKAWAQSDRFDKTHALLPAIAQAFDELTLTDIVHRDISPNNLMQDLRGGVHIIDFGFASDLKAETPSRLGEGTVKYRAPEIIEESEADTRTDQFSLACVFYFLLTGRSPSHGPSAELIEEFNENLPSTLSQVLTKAISDDKNARHNDFTIFFSALKQAFIQDIQARDELRPLQQNIDGWFEYQTGIQQTIKDYQQLQQSLLAPNTQLQVLKTAGLIGQDKLNTLLSYDSIEANITKHIKTLQGQDSTAESHIRGLRHTLNQLKQGESTSIPSLTTPPKVKQSDYLKLKSQVDDEVEAFNDLLAGIGEQMIGQIEQHSQWPDEELSVEITQSEDIINLLSKGVEILTEKFSEAKNVNEKQNKILTELHQFVTRLKQQVTDAQKQLSPETGLITNKAHLIASITERLESEQRIKALITEYQQFIEQCKTFNQTAKQTTEQLRLLNNNQKSTQPYWQKQWKDASESKLLSTTLMLVLLIAIITGVTYWSPFSNNGPEVKASLTRNIEGSVWFRQKEAFEPGDYRLVLTDASCDFKKNQQQQAQGNLHFRCTAETAKEQAYQLYSPANEILKDDELYITPRYYDFNVKVFPESSKVTYQVEKRVVTISKDQPLAEGRYELTIKAEGYHTKTQTINWPNSALTIQLEAIDNEPPRIELTNLLTNSRSTPQDKTYPVGNTSFTMKYIHAGTFMMGCVSGKGCKDNELPVHKVKLKAFYMMENEVTWNLYQQCINANMCADNGKIKFRGDRGWGKGERPVINISWEDITESFIPWLNKQTGQKFRLPSEAEWEYAARAGTDSKYSWGNSIECSKARYDGGKDSNCDDKNQNGEFKGTLPVKSYSPNSFGLYDMHGNVWEWTQDCWNDSYRNTPVGDGSSWITGDCNRRVYRGGAWNYQAEHLRSASRGGMKGAHFSFGFRLVQSEFSRSSFMDVVKLPSPIAHPECYSGKACDFNDKSIKMIEVSKTEITIDDWQLCVDGGVCSPKVSSTQMNQMFQHEHFRSSAEKLSSLFKNRTDFATPVNVAFSEAEIYINWLSKNTGYSYRLLTTGEFAKLTKFDTRVCQKHHDRTVKAKCLIEQWSQDSSVSFDSVIDHLSLTPEYSKFCGKPYLSGVGANFLMSDFDAAIECGFESEYKGITVMDRLYLSPIMGGLLNFRVARDID